MSTRHTNQDSKDTIIESSSVRGIDLATISADEASTLHAGLSNIAPSSLLRGSLSGESEGSLQRSSEVVSELGDALSGEVKQLAARIKAVGINELGDLLPAILGLGALSPMQLTFILQHLKAELIQRFRAGDLPTGLQPALHLFNFARSTATEVQFEVWSEVLVALDNNAKLSQNAIVVCLAAGQATSTRPPVPILQRLLVIIAGTPDVDNLQTSDWVLLLEDLARLQYNPGTDVLMQLFKLAQHGVIEGSKDGMPARDVSFYIGELIWAVVMVANPAHVPELLGPLLESLRARKENWTTPAASKLFAGLAYASALTEPLVAKLDLQNLGFNSLSSETLECLAHAYLTLPTLAKYIPRAALVEALTTQKERVAKRQDNRQAKIEASRVLSDLGIAHSAGLPLVEGLLTIDIAIQAGKTALMLPPSSCFCVNMTTQPIASATLEWQLLGAQGWKVIAIPVALWEVQSTMEAQIGLLRKAIQGPSAIEVYRSLGASIPRNLLGINLPSASKKAEESKALNPFSSRRSSDLDMPEGKQAQPSTVRANLSAQGSTTSTIPFSPRNPAHPLPRSSSAWSDFHGAPAQGSFSDLGMDQRASGNSSLHGSTQAGSASLHGSNQAASLLGSQSLPAQSSLVSYTSFPHGVPESLQQPIPGLAEQLSLNLAERFAAMNVDPQLGSSLSTQSQGSMPLAGDLSGSLQGFLPGPAMQQIPGSGLGPPALSGSQGLPRVGPLEGLGRMSNVSNLSSLGSGAHPLPGLNSQAFLPQGNLPLNSISSAPNMGGPPAQQGMPVGELEMRASMPSKSGDLRSLWQMVTQQVDLTQPIKDTVKRGASVSDMKRHIGALPLETNAVGELADRLAQLTPEQFAFLLTELARDNQAYRAWQLFDWVRGLPEDHKLRSLCDAHTYTTMISLCGPWQQVRRALSLVADMKQRSLQCGIQAYSALLNAAVKCSEVDLAVDVYRQMGQEGMTRDRHIFQTMVDIFVKMGRHSDALGVLDDMKASGQQVEVQLYNLIVLSCTKLNNPIAALDVYKRMAENGVQPNTKTFTALIGSVGKMSTLDKAMEIIEQLLSHEKDTDNLTTTYSALMSACEKAGQWDLAVALFDKMSSQGCKPDVSIFNSMIAACAHGGEYVKARLMFERMPEHGCMPEAVTYANLIRAYKKGGQWCHALDTFEAMQRSGCGPHAAVFSSIIDVLWQTGIAWAQAKALELFKSAVKHGKLAGAAESCKKGTLKVDLQALTVGVAVLSMASWLNTARQASTRDKAGSLDSARKLAIVNGLGEHSRAQGHSAAVKEAVGAGLLGCKAPFRLVQDHSRSGRLESSTLALRKWLFSKAFDAYYSLIHGGPEIAAQQMITTEQYLKKEVAESEHCFSVFKRIQRYETSHPVSFKLLHNQPGNYLALRKQLVNLTLQYASALGLSPETAHTALALMDRCVLAGMQVQDQFQPVLVCTCLRVAAIQESAYLPTPSRVHTVTNISASNLEYMESKFVAALKGDTECISAVHCLKTYLQRLGVDLSDGTAVQLAAGCAFALATHALAELPIMQFTPSLTAAAVLVAARKAQGSVPFWPSVLSQMTGYTEANTPAFASAISHAERLCSKLIETGEPIGTSETVWSGQYQQLQ